MTGMRPGITFVKSHGEGLFSATVIINKERVRKAFCIKGRGVMEAYQLAAKWQDEQLKENT